MKNQGNFNRLSKGFQLTFACIPATKNETILDDGFFDLGMRFANIAIREYNKNRNQRFENTKIYICKDLQFYRKALEILAKI